MKGYIYITGVGTDPGGGKPLEDPSLFRDPPSLGACMPNIRRFVDPGDWIFVISGKTKDLDQYVIGGFQVAEKVDALTAYEKLPANRLSKGSDGVVRGNVIVDEKGAQHPLDAHKPDEFTGRTHGFVIGAEKVVLTTQAEADLARRETVPMLERLTGVSGSRPIDIIGRMKKLDEKQIGELASWLSDVRRRAAGA